MRSIIFYGQTGKFTFRMLATVLGGQAICILLGALVARAVAATDEGSGPSTAYLVVGLGLGALSILAGRREDATSLYAEATGASGAEAQAIIRTWDTTQNY